MEIIVFLSIVIAVVAVMILTNTFNIVLAVFDVSQHVIQQSAGIIQNGTEITPDAVSYTHLDVYKRQSESPVIAQGFLAI